MSGMTKTVSVFHETPKPGKPFAILPIGFNYNRELRGLRQGDLVEFFNSEGTETREFVCGCVIPIKSSFFTFMARSIYGSWVTTAAIIRNWENRAIVLGHRDDVFSRDECVLIEVKP